MIALDTETHLIKPGLLAPRLVCVSWADDEGGSGVMTRNGAKLQVIAWLLGDYPLVGHNIAYDLAVIAAEWPVWISAIFRAYEKGLVHDTMIRQKLIDIAEGELKFHWENKPDGTGARQKTTHHLATLVKRHLGRTLEKRETFRLRYHEVDGLPYEEWPEEAKTYALDDAKATMEVYQAQERYGTIPNELEQTKAAWALHLMSTWGVRTDEFAIRELRTRLEKEQAEAKAKLATSGIFRENGTKDLGLIRKKVKAAWEANVQGPLTPLPTTPTGAVKTDEEVLLACGDPDLRILAEASSGAKLLNTYVPILERGTKAPICARYNVLVETGRTSCSDPNMQNPPRKGGVRECFVPRPGFVFCAVDYDTLELRALAQVAIDLFGHSEMAEALRRGEDLHLNLAAQILGIRNEEAAARMKAGDTEVEELRQLAKIANFGFPGGMASHTFVEYAAGFGVTVSEELAAKLRESWRSAWPEMGPYFDRISALTGGHEAKVLQPRSGRVRGGVSFCAAANGNFQGLAADGAKEALWRVSKECYDPTPEKESALLGSRPVIFLHDEIICEVPEARAHEAAHRLAEVMIESMAVWIPNVPISAKPCLMRRWYKGCKPVQVNGQLVPAMPEVSDGKTVWVPDILKERRAA